MRLDTLEIREHRRKFVETGPVDWPFTISIYFYCVLNQVFGVR